MESGNCLGIYLSKDTATVVCLGPEADHWNVLGCFSVSVDQDNTENQASPVSQLINLIVQECSARELEFAEAAVALDCTMFMQHNVHSEFSEPGKIAQTVRFDTEEVIAADISDIAMAFKITSSDQTGSKLTVFTAEQKVLSEILNCLQANNMDPVAIEPDVNCLSRFILQNVFSSEDLNPFFCMLSRRNGYFIIPHGSKSDSSSVKLTLRTFLIGPSQNRTELLGREVPVTIALIGSDRQVSCVKVYDTTGSVNYQQLSEKLQVETKDIDLIASAAIDRQGFTDCVCDVGFAIAYGAALSVLDSSRGVNFRDDFIPYQGRKVRLQETLKFLSIAVIVLILTVGLFFQLRLLKQNSYRSRLHKKFGQDYSKVMPGKQLSSEFDPVRKLESEKSRVQNVKSGQLSTSGRKSVSAKLTLVFKAFNECAQKTKLTIESVSITDRTIGIVGSTSNRRSTRDLREALEKNGLKILQDRLEEKAGRDNFTLTVAPK